MQGDFNSPRPSFLRIKCRNSKRFEACYFFVYYESTILSPTYKQRAKKLDEFNYINVYILSREDVAISKIIRLAEKDVEDLNEIIPKCDKTLLNKIIKEIIDREDLFESKKSEFIKKLTIFREKYNVDRFPKFKAFLWTLKSRNIVAEKYNEEKIENLEEQAKLVN